ncbi:MAG TPA: 2-C-methyl-D-erythritol 4-phosphate cytidylyltransferase [Gemmatimonadales bacterium]|nr:2-C-methyl-D-erythritol 4-phosphate cytidylyltransferase [Gemmatimonadales bacterium]
MPRDVGVVIVAAGQGRRLGGPPKQFRPIAGVPMVLRALRPFAAHPEVAHVVLVLPPADAAAPPRFLAEVAGAGLTLVAGGAERSDSVAAGLAALPPACRTVLVHDGVRPFPDPAVIDAVIREARSGRGAVAAVPMTDTVKEIDAADGRRVVRTVPRDTLWRAQTPQGFPRELLARAHQRARAEDRHGTDDAALVEGLGVEVRVVPDSPGNRKITTPEDLEWAEHWATRR